MYLVSENTEKCNWQAGSLVHPSNPRYLQNRLRIGTSDIWIPPKWLPVIRYLCYHPTLEVKIKPFDSVTFAPHCFNFVTREGVVHLSTIHHITQPDSSPVVSYAKIARREGWFPPCSEVNSRRTQKTTGDESVTQPRIHHATMLWTRVESRNAVIFARQVLPGQILHWL